MSENDSTEKKTMPENDGKQQWLESRLEEIERRLGHVHPSGTNIFRELYVSPRTILISVTLLNIALFIGGTVYTGVQVESIQKRFQEASQKILDARQKYDEAEAKVKQVQSFAEETKVTLRDIQRQAGDLAADVQKKSKESGNEITNIKTQADQQLELLKKSSASIVASMSSYQRETEAALSKAATEVALKLEDKIKFNKDAINDKQASVDQLGLKIEGLSAKVSQKDLELSKIQKGLEEQLGIAIKLNDEFTSKIKSIARTDKVSIPVAYDITDVWLKACFGGTLLVSILLSVMSLWKARSRS
jgi:chromosome segregation ATPase